MKKCLVLLAPLLIGALYSCYKPVQSSDHYVSRIASLYFRDSVTNAVLIGRSGQLHNPDSVSVYQPASGSGPSYPNGYAQDHDSSGKYAVRFAYFFNPAGSDDLTPFGYDYTFAVRFSAADTDTLRFVKTSGAPVRLYWNGHPIADIQPNTQDTSINIRK
ncbi:MAG: hypothetical protein EOP50_09195 [Sphingobacteriales bacterium]|nr:MAG: hypothetical protein EOP50_09195 [Sphingobacteriales bacterium]